MSCRVGIKPSSIGTRRDSLQGLQQHSPAVAWCLGVILDPLDKTFSATVERNPDLGTTDAYAYDHWAHSIRLLLDFSLEIDAQANLVNTNTSDALLDVRLSFQELPCQLNAWMHDWSIVLHTRVMFDQRLDSLKIYLALAG